MKKSLLILFLLSGFFAKAQNYFPTQTPFGKNRIQYRHFHWKVLTTQNFEVYFYDDALPMATVTAQFAESEFDRITEMLGYSPFSRTKIFVYSSVQDINQSNIGITLSSDKEVSDENLSKSRIEIAFSGNQVAYKKELVREISHVFVYDMLYGGSLKDALQNSLLLSVPEWFMNGVTAYIAEGWSVEMDDFMRDALLNKKLRKPNLATGKEAALIGQSIWNYIAEKNGRDNISNILNLTRIIRNEQTSIASTLGMPYSRFLREWHEYYSSMADNVNSSFQAPKIDLKVKQVKVGDTEKLNKFKISPDGSMVAFSTNNLGRSAVEVYNFKTKKTHTLFNIGYKTLNQSINYNTPLLSWTRGNSLAVIFENGGSTELDVFTDFSDKKPAGKLSIYRYLDFDQVSDFDISDDGTNIVLSAEKKGQNDLFLYNISRKNTVQLTNDLYDDLYPQFVGNAGKVIFTSNRLKDSLDVDKGSFKSIGSKFSLFVHDGKPKSESVRRLVESNGMITRPVVTDGSTVYFLNDEKGVRNIYRLVSGDSLATQMTAYRNNIIDFDINVAKNLVFRTAENQTDYIAYQNQADFNATGNYSITPRISRITGVPMTEKQEAKTNNATPLTNVPAEVPKPAEPTIVLAPGEVDTDNYQFDNLTVTKPADKKTDVKKSRNERNNIARQTRKDNIKIKGPTDYTNPFVVNGTDGNFVVDPVRGLGYSFAVTMNDLLENHQLKGGIFITPNLKNSDLWAEYSYLPKRVDFTVRFDRKVLSQETETLSQKVRFNRLSASASYPFNANARLTISPSYTSNRAINLYSVSTPEIFSDYLGANAEFVYDNTISSGVNALEGTRFKVKYEHFTGLASAKDGFERFTADIRHYLKVGQYMILAGRLSGGHSFGDSPKQFIMGGMDNWLFIERESRNTNNPLGTGIASKDIFLSDFATSLRGFNVNKLSGVSNLLFNVELRIPIVRYLTKNPIYSNFFKNLQLSAFTDVGTAWTGASPFSRKNGFNTIVYGGGTNPFQATVTDFRNPFLVGYGVGARTTMLGYFVKFDVGWGMENKDIKSPISYLTLGYDF
ncbi:hypothetical protein SAMN04515674_102226 [Pseudarcicella hirudinis]|uniref:WD40-like Beta Propeller Repeat n=1 Tax=Pseudarcicella hirudinis TaxID=1079859 RepID=A0A1I5P1D6_9BACT|nr:hypothetical protein [Pseudarcicella hirudinis]SFP27855.1 hypothetical protein SAMN04515674_102226 [Pseudarcicella hirudinis]